MTIKFERCLRPPGVDFGATDEPVICDRWKNLVFKADGTTILAREVHPSEYAARALSDRWEAAMRYATADGSVMDIFDPDTNTLLFEFPTNYSHTVQIPWERP